MQYANHMNFNRAGSKYGCGLINRDMGGIDRFRVRSIGSMVELYNRPRENITIMHKEVKKVQRFRKIVEMFKIHE